MNQDLDQKNGSLPYEAPAIESVLQSDKIEREAHYAGTPSGGFDA